MACLRKFIVADVARSSSTSLPDTFIKLLCDVDIILHYLPPPSILDILNKTQLSSISTFLKSHCQWCDCKWTIMLSSFIFSSYPDEIVLQIFFFLNNILFCFPNNLRMIFLCFFLPWFHNWHLAHAFFVHNSLDHLVGGTALQPSRGISRSGNCRPTVSLRKCLRRLPEAQFPVQYSFYAFCSTFAHWLQNDQCLLVDAEYTYLTGDDDVIVIWSIRNVLLIATMWIIVIFS